ncbi:extracellular solute-binding protein [Vogesella sp. LIG4]|uniref:extracellular solute-binding protein n=1 Tax=Vogesella sp. LIG4 TaxID=1192162 RepID=UPI00081FFEBF|nr:extracellular solute-binding protein [Vogesella sp. LIG4]SCK25589.1 putrescine transport system substrate-binding protein [Vogesella sp. LIG4]
MKSALHNKGVATLLAAGALTLATGPALAESQVVNVYNWANSIGKDTVANFEKTTGIKVEYQTFDSNDTVQAKLLTGSAQYDVVVPSNLYWTRQIPTGVFQQMDLKKIPNYGKLDPKIMNILKSADPTQRYGLPWAWGTDGMGINVEKVQAALGKNAPLDSLALFFDVNNLKKLKSCGVSIVDEPLDGFGIALLALHKDPNTTNRKDYDEAYKLLKTLRPYITQFNSSTYINDLAGGDVCLALGWSGDVNAARRAALAAKKPYHIRYVIPKEGAAVWFNMMSIPKNAPHPDAAHKFINFVLSERESANLTNDTNYPSAVPGANPLVSPEALADPMIYPTPEVFRRLYVGKPVAPDLMRYQNRLWTQLKSGIN